VFGGAGDDRERDPFVAGDQQAAAGWAGEQVAALAGGEVEALADLVDRLRRLAEQELGGGVADDCLTQLSAEQVGGGAPSRPHDQGDVVLGDRYFSGYFDLALWRQRGIDEQPGLAKIVLRHARWFQFPRPFSPKEEI